MYVRKFYVTSRKEESYKLECMLKLAIWIFFQLIWKFFTSLFIKKRDDHIRANAVLIELNILRLFLSDFYLIRAYLLLHNRLLRWNSARKIKKYFFKINNKKKYLILIIFNLALAILILCLTKILIVSLKSTLRF